MTSNTEHRRQDAIAIWQAGVDAVKSDHLVESSVSCDGEHLSICGRAISLATLGRIEVVGCGKAGTGMSRGMLTALSPIRDCIRLDGWVNVQADCVEPLVGITLHSARPAGVNEPTNDGVTGTDEIIRRLQSLNRNDLCLVLISGGGSALLPAPAPPVTLEDKQIVTRFLAASGAPIDELNTVRSQISLVKGGGLIKHCRAGLLMALIISDVIDDPLDVIASGPTTPTQRTTQDALDILNRYDSDHRSVPESVYKFLHAKPDLSSSPTAVEVNNFVIGSNSVAVAAAAQEAKKRGYEVVNLGSDNSGDASEHGRTLIQRLRGLQNSVERNVCLLAGGETTVELAETTQPRRGGRNQEVVLAAVAEHANSVDWRHLTLLSGGTDGEDGPTDAAGAFADSEVIESMLAQNLDAQQYLAINDSYNFFQATDGLLQTGPTHTNVMDLAVGLSQKP